MLQPLDTQTIGVPVFALAKVAPGQLHPHSRYFSRWLAPVVFHHLPYLVDTPALTTQMQDRMAVRTDRSQILGRIDHVLAADFR
jgi:hypothetical protein